MIDLGFGVQLRTIKENELEQMLKWRNNPKIWRWCRQSDLIPYADHIRWHKTNTEKMYGIHDGLKFLGVAGLTSVDEVARRAEFSCYIGPGYHRQGYCRRALKTLFKHGFENLNLNLIWGETISGNPALELFKSLGMQVEGVRRDFYYKAGSYQNCTLISIKRSECGF